MDANNCNTITALTAGKRRPVAFIIIVGTTTSAATETIRTVVAYSIVSSASTTARASRTDFYAFVGRSAAATSAAVCDHLSGYVNLDAIAPRARSMRIGIGIATRHTCTAATS